MSFEESQKRWKEGYRVVIICSNCKDRLHSRYSGEFVQCKCGDTFVDQTPYYVRAGGNDPESDIINILEDKNG